MRFTVDSKDMKIFVAFCIFLLYLCAILVLNAHSFATNGEFIFYGFLPFEAFTSDYIGATFLLFIFILIGIFFSVKSYIFERDKGFGFGAKKDKGGYSRWCKDSEMKKSLSEVDPSADRIEHAGIPIISDGKKMWVDDGEAHNLRQGDTKYLGALRLNGKVAQPNSEELAYKREFVLKKSWTSLSFNLSIITF